MHSFFVGAWTVINLLQTTRIISDVCFITDHAGYASSNKTVCIKTELVSFLFTLGGYTSCSRACLGSRLLPQSYQYPDLSEGADCIGGQLHGDKECSFSGITKSVVSIGTVVTTDTGSSFRGGGYGPFPFLCPCIRRKFVDWYVPAAVLGLLGVT